MKYNPRKTDRQITDAIIRYPTLTYNQVAKKIGSGNDRVKELYRELVDDGTVNGVVHKHHYKSIRKTRVRLTDEHRTNIIAAFKSNPGMAIANVAALVGHSFGACYRVHDTAVLAGQLKTHRKLRTCVASGPPLYVGG